MQQDKDAEIASLMAVIAAKDAVISDKDAMIAAKDAEIAAKDAEITKSLDFMNLSIHAVTAAVNVLRVNGRCDLALMLMPILNQLKEHCYNFCNGQVAHPFYRHRGVETNTDKMEDTAIAGSDRPGDAGNPAPGEMVQAHISTSTSTGNRCFEGGRYKDLEHAILDLNLQVALLTV